MRVEYVMLADHAEVVNNKLYVMAGGWDVLTLNRPLPAPHVCGIVAAFMVPWNETNEVHPVEVEVLDPDGQGMARIEGQLEVGRPPGITHGQEQRIHLAANLALAFEKLGPYVVKARAGEHETSTRFTVIPGPGMPQVPPTGLPAPGPTP